MELLRKAVWYAIPLALLGFFCFIMTQASSFKQPRGGGDDVPKYLTLSKDALIDRKWARAIDSLSHLDRAWKKVLPRIQYAAERDEINGVSIGIARSAGYVSAKDRAGALAELAEVEAHWETIGN